MCLLQHRLEKPCMDHMQMLCAKSHDSETEISGHVLMASCPTERHLIERPDVPYPNQMPDMGASDLQRLLDISNRLPLDYEITPIMAWALILQHQYFQLLTSQDIANIRDELLAKVRCYG